MKYYIYDFKTNLDQPTMRVGFGTINNELITHTTNSVIIPNRFMFPFNEKYISEISSCRNYFLSNFDNISQLYHQVSQRIQKNESDYIGVHNMGERIKYLTSDFISRNTVLDMDQVKRLFLVDVK